MRTDFLIAMGRALRARRQQRGLSQPALAHRLGRARARITELEVDLLHGRVGRDRLGLLTEACDALDLTPVLVPRERAQAVQRLLSPSPGQAISTASGRAFDDVFVDLADADDEEAT